MINYKFEAAKSAAKLIEEGQVIGLGAGSTVSYLVDAIEDDQKLASSLTFVSSSFNTNNYLLRKNMKITAPSMLARIDLYFDGCDQFDQDLNALKSGGAIHTMEKILADMADRFILMGDDSKFKDQLDGKVPLVVEILPPALLSVLRKLSHLFSEAEITLRADGKKDGAVISDSGNFLADVRFPVFPELNHLNSAIKMIPGIVDHSLFYRMADCAIVAGAEGARMIEPASY